MLGFETAHLECVVLEDLQSGGHCPDLVISCSRNIDLEIALGNAAHRPLHADQTPHYASRHIEPADQKPNREGDCSSCQQHSLAAGHQRANARCGAADFALGRADPAFNCLGESHCETVIVLHGSRALILQHQKLTLCGGIVRLDDLFPFADQGLYRPCSFVIEIIERCMHGIQFSAKCLGHPVEFCALVCRRDLEKSRLYRSIGISEAINRAYAIGQRPELLRRFLPLVAGGFLRTEGRQQACHRVILLGGKRRQC